MPPYFEERMPSVMDGLSQRERTAVEKRITALCRRIGTIIVVDLDFDLTTFSRNDDPNWDASFTTYKSGHLTFGDTLRGRRYEGYVHPENPTSVGSEPGVIVGIASKPALWSYLSLDIPNAAIQDRLMSFITMAKKDVLKHV